MKKIKIIHIIGARPQFIKYFPIQKAIDALNASCGFFIENILVHTGQHYDYMMSEALFNELGIKKPDYHLEVGSAMQGLQTALIIQRSEEVLIKENPNVVLVYGDTNSTLGGAIAAAKLNIPIMHIEAGLRSYNRKMPEEINRIIVDRISSVLFCPSEIAVANLIKEGFTDIVCEGKLIPKNEGAFKKINIDISSSIVINVGDVMYDVLLLATKNASEKSKIINELNLKHRNYAILTIHRAENTDDFLKLKEIIEFTSQAVSDLIIIFPVHPRTKKTIEKNRLILPFNIRAIEPISYYDMVELLKNSKIIFTDSGGLQKEAYWLKIPCITLREETEWIETIQSGWNILYKNWKGLHNPIEHNPLAYGDGKAAERIVKIIATGINRNM